MIKKIIKQFTDWIVIFKKIIFHSKIRKYVFSNPRSLLYTKYDSVIENALYGKANELLRNRELEITIEDYLSSYNIENKKEEINIPIKYQGPTDSISVFETQVLCKLTKGIKAKSIFEIGTFEGRNAVNIANNIDKNAKFYTLDLPQKICKFEVGKYIKEKNHKIVQLFGNSEKFDFSKFHNKIDIMFIDGYHHYKTVLLDSENAMKCVKDNGFIVWHDLDFTQLGTSYAIFQICKKYNLQLKKISGTVMGIARKKPGNIIK
ncbi:MAG: class I SAM-dependent methyltransferase [Candidatus Marinimicrobia bacterium]|nr:class I SAM-dependent methyltransferase [Candidatus Neomarinimicrobiota bacterium]